MKKRAFTLAETLIALGIVAVLVVLTLPMINKHKPDVTKIKYLKTYDTVTEIVQNLSTDTSKYKQISEKFSDVKATGETVERQFDYSTIPFYNVPTQNGEVQSNILAKYISKVFTAKDGNVSNEYKEGDDAINELLTNRTFQTSGGIDFYITTYYKSPEKVMAKWYGEYLTDIYINTNTSKDTHCMYNATTCPKPDIFKISIDAHGKLYAGDLMSANYLNTRTNWLKKSTKFEIGIDNPEKRFVIPLYGEEYEEEEENLCKMEHALDSNNTKKGACVKCEPGYMMYYDNEITNQYGYHPWTKCVPEGGNVGLIVSIPVKKDGIIIDVPINVDNWFTKEEVLNFSDEEIRTRLRSKWRELGYRFSDFGIKSPYSYNIDNASIEKVKY